MVRNYIIPKILNINATKTLLPRYCFIKLFLKKIVTFKITKLFVAITTILLDHLTI